MSGKKYRLVVQKVQKETKYTPQEAMAFIVENKLAKFDESVEVHVKLGIDTKKGEQQIRGAVVLPHGTGKEKKIAVATTTAQSEAREAGADFVYGEEIAEKIKSGKFFSDGVDVIVATPEMMPKLAPVAKILGPRGLMPSPKAETVTTKVKESVEMLKKGKVNFKNDGTGNVHQIIGKSSFTAKDLAENLESFMEAIIKAKPASVKGKYIVSVSACSTMGPSLKIAL